MAHKFISEKNLKGCPKKSGELISEVEQRKKKEGEIENGNDVLLLTRSFWPSALESQKFAGRVIMVMRSAERVDRIFGENWKDTEAPYEQLCPTDLNLPYNSDIKLLLNEGVLENNPPITTFGKYTSQLMARSLHNRGLVPSLVICSPALRAVQTAASIAQMIGVKIAIEPGLLEPLIWSRLKGGNTLPYFALSKLAEIYPIDLEKYSPIITIADMKIKMSTETESDGIDRIDFVLRNLAAQQRQKSLLIVAHAVTLSVAVKIAASSRDIEGSSKSGSDAALTSFELPTFLIKLDEPFINSVDLGLRFPPGSVLSMIQMNTAPPYTYKLVSNIVPPLTYGKYFSNNPILDNICIY